MDLAVEKPCNGERGDGGGGGGSGLKNDTSTVQSDIHSNINNISGDTMERDVCVKGANENHQEESVTHSDRLKVWHVPKAPMTVLSEANNNVIHEKDEMRASPSSFQHYTPKELDDKRDSFEDDCNGLAGHAFKSYMPDSQPSKSPYSLLPSKSIMTGKTPCRRTPPPLIKDKVRESKSPLGIAPIFEQTEQPIVHIPSNLLFSESAATLTHAENSPNYQGKDEGNNPKDRNVIVIAPEEPRSMCQDEPMDLSKTAPEPNPEPVAHDNDSVLDLSRNASRSSIFDKLPLHSQTPPPPKIKSTKPKPRHSAPSKYSHNVPTTPSSSSSSHAAAPVSPSSSRSSTPGGSKKESTDPGAQYWNMWNPYMAAYSHYMNMALLSGSKTQSPASATSVPSVPSLPGANIGALPFPPPTLPPQSSPSTPSEASMRQLKEECMSDESDTGDDVGADVPGMSSGQSPASNKKRGKPGRVSSLLWPNGEPNTAAPPFLPIVSSTAATVTSPMSSSSSSAEALAECVMRWAPTHGQGSVPRHSCYAPKHGAHDHQPAHHTNMLPSLCVGYCRYMTLFLLPYS